MKLKHFCGLVETISRLEDMKFFLLANSVTVNNPYFIYIFSFNNSRYQCDKHTEKHNQNKHQPNKEFDRFHLLAHVFIGNCKTYFYVQLFTFVRRIILRNIKIIPGDGVKLEMSPYDLTKGRIVWRSKN